MKIKINKVFKCLACLVACLSVFIVGILVPVNAAELPSSIIDPADYPTDIVIEGDVKTITFDFSGIQWGYYFSSDVDGSTVKFGDFNLSVPQLARAYEVMIYPFGQPVAPDNISSSNFGCLYVGDISPGSAIDFSFEIQFNCLWQNHSSSMTHQMTVVQYWLYDLYDDDGTYISTIQGQSKEVQWNLESYPSDNSKLAFNDKYVISGAFPSSATYVRPRIHIDCVNTADFNILSFGVSQGPFKMSVDINTVLENSNLQHAILDKLDQILDSDPESDADIGKVEDAINNQISAGKDAIAGLESMQKPDVGSVDMSAGSSLSSNSALLLSSQLRFLWDLDVMNKILLALIGVLTLSYVIFGKKR